MTANRSPGAKSGMKLILVRSRWRSAATSALAQTAPLRPRPQRPDPDARKRVPRWRRSPGSRAAGAATANQREFREHWMPLRGNLLVGVSQTVMQGKTQGYEYLRLEPRADGVYYVAAPSGKNETAFRLTEQTVDRTDGPQRRDLHVRQSRARVPAEDHLPARIVGRLALRRRSRARSAAPTGRSSIRCAASIANRANHQPLAPEASSATPRLASASARSLPGWSLWPLTQCQRIRCRAASASSSRQSSAFLTGFRSAVFQPFFFQPWIQLWIPFLTYCESV